MSCTAHSWRRSSRSWRNWEWNYFQILGQIRQQSFVGTITTIENNNNGIFIGCAEVKSIKYAQYISNKLRLNNGDLVIESYLGNANVSKQLKKANSLGFKFVIIIGQEEQNTKIFKVKSLKEEKELSLNEKELMEFFNG